MSNKKARDELFLNLAAFLRALMVTSETENLDQLAGEDLTLTQIRTMLIASGGDSFTVTQIAEQLDVSTTAASRGVDRLVQLGLLSRRTSKTDRRVKLVTITDKGVALIDEHRESRVRTLRIFIDALPAEHVADLSASLEPIISDPEFTKRSKSVFWD